MRKIYPVVIGLGYVGLPIFLNLQKYFKTIGFDVNNERIHSLKKKYDYNKEFKSSSLKLKKNSVLTDNLNINLEDLPLTLEIAAGVTILILLFTANF